MNRKRLASALFFAALLGLGRPTDAAGPETPDALYTAAERLVERARAARAPAARAKLWSQAERSLNRLVERFPDSTLVKNLSAGRSIGGVSLDGVRSAARDARCRADLTPACLFDAAAAEAARLADRAARNRLTATVAELRAWSGDAAGAAGMIRATADPATRLAATRALPGKGDKAARLRISRAMAMTLRGVSDPHALPLLAARHLRSGDTGEADFVLERLIQESRYVVTIDQRWAPIVIGSFETVLRRGGVRVAESVARRNAKPAARAEALALLAIAARRAGRDAMARRLLAAARKDFAAIPAGKAGPRVVAQIAWAAAVNGDPAGAGDLLSRAERLALKSPYKDVLLGHLAEIAAIRATIGQAGAAKALLDRTEKILKGASFQLPDDRLYRMTDIAVARAAAGDRRAFRRLIAKVDATGFKEPFYSYFMERAAVRVGLGDREGGTADLRTAVALVAGMKNTLETHRNDRRADIARLQLMLGDRADAVVTAKLISEPGHRVLVLAHLAVWLSLKK